MAGQKLEIGSTGVKIPKGDWDEKKKEVAESNPTCMPYNATLNKIKSRLVNVFNELSDRDQPFTTFDVKFLYNSKFPTGGHYHTLLERFQEYYQERKKSYDAAVKAGTKPPKGSALGTLKTIPPIITKLKEFLKEQKVLKITPLSFDQDYYEEYIHWMRRKGHKGSTARAHCNKIKQLYGWMKRKKYINKNELEGLPLPEDPGTKPQPLNIAEYERLKRTRFKVKKVQQAADLFIIYCRTGFHYQDLMNVIAESRVGISVTHYDEDGIEWMYHDRQKTEEWAKFPILDDVARIVRKYGGWGQLPRFDNSSLNELLKIVAGEAGLPENLCVSHGRDTMTDWLLNERLVSQETVMVILGRKDGRDLKRYGSADARRVKKELIHSL